MLDAFTAWLLYMSIQLGMTRTSVCWCTMSAELPVAARRSACLYLACSSAAAVGCVGPGMGTGLGVGLGADLGWNWDWGLAASAGSFAFCKQARRTIQKQMLSMRIKRTAVDFIRMLDALTVCLVFMNTELSHGAPQRAGPGGCSVVAAPSSAQAPRLPGCPWQRAEAPPCSWPGAWRRLQAAWAQAWARAWARARARAQAGAGTGAWQWLQAPLPSVSRPGGQFRTKCSA